MKKGIHPVFFDTTVTCACGNVMEVSSTKANQRVDICNACHPFYTGTHKIMDTEGRVERFRSKYAKAQAGAKK
jgi:large subunit ribosomal protein L31